ncbi:hypothetical protein Csac_1892 [Caldicellulosiruptor saccharolyticus DSM 8903]|uniref:PRC-barrel domain-containing protein n=2 Tax=Caldicellulosiruptor TaxID=44000 RepID=A4XKP2_CALS8|nr:MULTISPECIES: PRC-barrel domain-containing protein [Caldicellulosiruptor]ABP67477.2 hypothetical protein Csac_1892 [Caldicellulosiruptor saccharolyticus DSM 8903]
MQVSFKRLKGRTAVLVDGRFLGNICNMFFLDSNIHGFQIQKNAIFRVPSNIYILANDVESVNNELLIVSRSVLYIEQSYLVKADEILSKEVIGEGGNLIGIVDDILFDSESLKITGYEVVESIWSYIKNKKIILSPEEIILKENKILS